MKTPTELSSRLDPWTKWAAFIGFMLLIGAAAATLMDVLLRWLFNMPIEGWDDLVVLSEREGWTEMFGAAGVKLIDPGCGACIGAGPGVSDNPDQVTVSAINRNFQGRSGPGRLYLASPLTVMASAFTGKITAWRPDLFE